MSAKASLYDRVGGRPFFELLTRRFYQGVAADPTLRPLYPAGDEGLEAARFNLELFLIQFWGGPADYLKVRGQPRLRMRHARFAIGPAERDAWVAHMTAAVRAAGLRPLDEMQLLGYLTSVADQLVNQK
jgi:hemoglobin